MKQNVDGRKLKIAIQKSGRLYDDSISLLKECVGDVGIVGENVLNEKCREVEVLEKLGFGKCRLSLAINKNEEYVANYLQGKRIATSYPVLLKKYLDANNVTAEIHEISGSVEIAPGIGLADVICDLVSSGSTLFMNGLKEVETVLESQAVLVRNKELNQHTVELVEKLLFRIRAVKKAKRNKYILLNAPNEQLPRIFELLPGMKSPTVLPLAESGWSSVHSVLSEDEFWEKIEQLMAAGAEGILVVPIEKMIV